MSGKQVRIFAWGVSLLSAMVAVFAWGDLYRWKFNGPLAYQLFPLFGLLAFSLMWSHYIAAVIRIHSRVDKKELASYFEVTSLIVLVAIVLHPGLLIWQQWRIGAGLPPGSTLEYVGPTLKIAVISGMIAWVIFMAYEFRRKFGDRSWWKYVGYASDGAMLLVFVHGLRLGTHLQGGWFRYLWLIYGVTLIGSLLYLHTRPAKPVT